MSCKAISLLLAAVGTLVASVSPLRAQQDGTGSQLENAVLEGGTPQHWALLIGIDDYTELTDNKYCAEEAARLRNRLVLGGWPVSNVFLMNDRARSKYLPSRGNIERQLSLLPQLAATGDLVLVAFRGRVASVGGKSYLCPTEASLESPEETLVSIDALFRGFAESKARNNLVLIDPIGDADDTPTVLTSAFFESLRKAPPNTAVLVGCGPNQNSAESPRMKGGAFVAAVLRAMEGSADRNRDRSISLWELLQFAREETSRLAANAGTREQTPKFYGRVAVDREVGRVSEYNFSEGLYPLLRQDAAETSARLEAVVGINPRSLRAFNQAVSDFAMGDFREAAEYCDNAAAMDPENRWALALRGCIHCRLRDFAKAVEDYSHLGIPLPCHAKQKTDLKQGSATTATVLPGDVLYVTTVKGDWLWVDAVGSDKSKRGFIHKNYAK